MRRLSDNATQAITRSLFFPNPSLTNALPGQLPRQTPATAFVSPVAKNPAPGQVLVSKLSDTLKNRRHRWNSTGAALDSHQQPIPATLPLCIGSPLNGFNFLIWTGALYEQWYVSDLTAIAKRFTQKNGLIGPSLLLRYQVSRYPGVAAPLNWRFWMHISY